MDWNQRFVILDIETTGLNYEYWDEITEIAAIEVINKKITGNQKHFYIKPYKKVNLDFLNKVFGKNLLKETNEKSFKILMSKNEKNLQKEKDNENYLKLNEKIQFVLNESNKMLNNINSGKNKKNVLPELKDFIGDSIIVGHNIQFDVDFLNFWNNELNIPLYKNYICTLKNFKKQYKQKENNLKACCNYFNISLDNAHNAIADTTATAELFLQELNEFEPNIEVIEEYKAYANFKKRVIKASYCDFTKMVLSDSCKIPENTENIDNSVIDYCKNLFFKFKKPIDVSNITGLELESVEAIFIEWINCININKHQDFIKDKYLLNTIQEILKYSERDISKIELINKDLVDKEANLFIFKLFEKLLYKKDSMNYDLNDFDFYFKNNKNLNDLCKKIERNEEYLYDFLIKWINTDNQKFLSYKNFIKENYIENSSNPTQMAIYKAVNNNANKSYLLRQLNIL